MKSDPHICFLLNILGDRIIHTIFFFDFICWCSQTNHLNIFQSIKLIKKNKNKKKQKNKNPFHQLNKISELIKKQNKNQKKQNEKKSVVYFCLCVVQLCTCDILSSLRTCLLM